jgi:hypothetical protein
MVIHFAGFFKKMPAGPAPTAYEADPYADGARFDWHVVERDGAWVFSNIDGLEVPEAQFWQDMQDSLWRGVLRTRAEGKALWQQFLWAPRVCVEVAVPAETWRTPCSSPCSSVASRWLTSVRDV